MDRCLHFTSFSVMKGGINLKLKLTKNQQKVLAEIFEKIALGTAATTLIKGVIYNDPNVSGLEMLVLSGTSLVLLLVSIIMRKEA